MTEKDEGIRVGGSREMHGKKKRRKEMGNFSTKRSNKWHQSHLCILFLRKKVFEVCFFHTL